MLPGGCGMALLRKLTDGERRTIGHWAMELVVVVAGVLIALWLQQWADDRRARRDLAAAEDAIHEEVRTALTSLVWRRVVSRCHLERARLLKAMLLRPGNQWPGLNENALLQNQLSEATGVDTIMPGVYQRPFDAFSTAAWNSALTTGVLAPMDHQRFGQLVRLYDQIELLKENQKRENDAAATLSALSAPQELTADSRTRMFQALYQIDTSRFFFTFAGAQPISDAMKKLGWNDKAAIDKFIAEDRAEDFDRAAKWRPCIQPYKNPFDAK
jgi:hypothetical protein